MFLRGPNPIWFMNDHNGNPLDDTYWAFFLTNTLPYIPQAVYQDPNGNIPWSDPIEFQPSAGLPNNLYFDPELTYRIEIRQGNTQNDPLIWLIENYTLAGEGGNENSIALTTAENMITNPQFADIDFVSPLVITTAGRHTIAPGWELVTTGVGSTTITQAADPGLAVPAIQGNPPYRLTFNSSGWSTVELVQRFTNNGAIFGAGAIAVAFSAFSVGSPQILSVVYAPSVGVSTTIFPLTGFTPIPVGTLQPFSAAKTLPASTNSDSDGAAFVDIKFVLPPAGTVALTNIQITGQSLPLPSDYMQSQNPLFQETTYERIVDHEFHVYRDSILLQPKDNILAGWTFALNPWQFRTVASTNVSNTQFYTADQTIVIQQNVVATNTGNNVSVGRAIAANNYAFQVTAVTATNQFAIIQYIDASTIRPYWGQILSALVRAKVLSPTHSTTPRFKMRLIYRDTAVPTIAQMQPITTWLPASGITRTEPVFTAGWTPIIPLNDPEYTLSTISQGFSFDQFQLPPATTDTMFLGIVIYFTTQMDSTATADSILFDRVSLVQNDFAIDASTETYDETFRKCQYYYETSYLTGGSIATATISGMKNVLTPLNANGASSGVLLYARTFELPYDQIKRSASPTVALYSPYTGATGNVSARVWNGTANQAGPSDKIVTSFWSILTNSYKDITYQPNTATQLLGAFVDLGPNQGMIEFHYTADARLGIVP